MESIDLDARFNYHAPDEARAQVHEDFRTAVKALAEDVVMRLPEGRERSLVLTKLEEAMFWGNAAIARQ